MDTSVLENARADRVELANRLEHLDAEMADLRGRIAKIDTFIEVWDVYARPPAMGGANVQARSAPSAGDDLAAGVAGEGTPGPAREEAPPVPSEDADRQRGDGRPPGQMPTNADLRRLTIADGCAAIIRANGGTAQARLIVGLLRQAGKLTPGNLTRQYDVVAKTLKRKPERFVRIAPGVWGLREQEASGRPLPPLPSGEEVK